MLYYHISNPVTIVMRLPIPSLLAHQSNTALSDGEVYMSLGEIVTISLIRGERCTTSMKRVRRIMSITIWRMLYYVMRSAVKNGSAILLFDSGTPHQSHWVMEKRETLRIKGDFGTSVITYYVRVSLFHDIFLCGPMAVTFASWVSYSGT